MGLSEDLCEEHADEAAFLWSLRDRATSDWAYDTLTLADLEERVDAHVDGLRVASDAGLLASFAALEEDGEPGSAFVAMLLAVERSDLRSIAKVLDLAGEGPSAREIVSALGWAPWERVQRIMPGLLSARCPPALHWIGLGACAAHRMDPGPALAYALYSEDERLLARALRTVGQLGRKEMLHVIEDRMVLDSEACRFWATWTAMLLGSGRAQELLWSVAAAGNFFSERACALASRKTIAENGLSHLSDLAAQGHLRVSLAGAAALGDVAMVPWLFEIMEEPAAARRAGLAFTMLTGLDLKQEKLQGQAPQGFVAGPNDDPEDEDVAMDPDEDLPWPDVPVLRGWWSREGARFMRGTRYFLGKPLSREWLETVLHAGRQPAREAAAVEMVLRGHTKILSEVRATGFGRIG